MTPAQRYELNQVTPSVLNTCCAEYAKHAQNHLDDSKRSTDPLIAELKPLSTLRAEYEGGSESFLKEIDFLQGQGYEGIRRSRGDGDCFYRCMQRLSLRFYEALNWTSSTNRSARFCIYRTHIRAGGQEEGRRGVHLDAGSLLAEASGSRVRGNGDRR